MKNHCFIKKKVRTTVAEEVGPEAIQQQPSRRRAGPKGRDAPTPAFDLSGPLLEKHSPRVGGASSPLLVQEGARRARAPSASASGVAGGAGPGTLLTLLRRCQGEDWASSRP